MESTSFDNEFIRGAFTVSQDNKLVRIAGFIKDRHPVLNVSYVAAAPPDYRASFTGSGLPFASPAQAFDNESNMGVAPVDPRTRQFAFQIAMPNAYYAGLGTIYVQPTVYLTYVIGKQSRTVGIHLSEGIPYRMLTYPMTETIGRKDATFYDTGSLPVRTQEQILRDSEYPSYMHMYRNFWGLRPPV